MEISAEKTWTVAQEKLRAMLSADTYNLWFAPLRTSALEGNCIVLDVANDFCEVWLKDNYMGLLQDVLSQITVAPMQVKFKVVAGNSLAPAHAAAHAAVLEKAADLVFNPKNTFDSFVVGNNNNFAH